MRILGMRKVGKLELAVLLLLLGGGAFLYWAMGLPDKKETFNPEPTRWSQAEDYEIKEENGKTIVANKKAGFLFVAPEEWRITEDSGFTEEEFFLLLLSPEAKLNENNSLVQGCMIGVNSHSQQVEVNNLRAEIHYLQENPEETSTADYEQKLMHISAKSALWTTYKPPEDPELLRRIGENTNIAIISSESSLLEIGLRMMPERKSPCERQFNTLISSIAFN